MEEVDGPFEYSGEQEWINLAEALVVKALNERGATLEIGNG
jgi:hypothetical protein